MRSEFGTTSRRSSCAKVVSVRGAREDNDALYLFSVLRNRAPQRLCASRKSFARLPRRRRLLSAALLRCSPRQPVHWRQERQGRKRRVVVQLGQLPRRPADRWVRSGALSTARNGWSPLLSRHWGQPNSGSRVRPRRLARSSSFGKRQRRLQLRLSAQEHFPLALDDIRLASRLFLLTAPRTRRYFQVHFFVGRNAHLFGGRTQSARPIAQPAATLPPHLRHPSLSAAP